MHNKSLHLTALLQHWNTPRRKTRAEKALFEHLADYPHNKPRSGALLALGQP